MRVGILCGSPPRDTAYLDALSELVDLTVYCSVWEPGREVTHLPAAAPYRARRYRPLVRSRGGSLHYVYRGLRAHVREDQLDVLHVYPEPWGLLAQQAASITRHGAPALILHGCDNLWHHGSRPEMLLRKRLARRALSRARAYAAENGESIQLAIASGLPATSPTATIHTNPRDPSTFRLAIADERRDHRSSLGLRPDLPLVAFFGRTTPEKGIDNFIDAIAQINCEDHRVEAIVAGEFGDGRAATKTRAEQVGIRCVGSLSYPDEVAAALRVVDVLCVPSLETPAWKEQGPRIVIEALMSGATVVGSDTAGIRGLLDGAGHLTAPTASGLVSGIHDALAAREVGAASVDECRAQAIRRFGPSAVAAQLHDLWSRALDQCERPDRAEG